MLISALHNREIELHGKGEKLEDADAMEDVIHLLTPGIIGWGDTAGGAGVPVVQAPINCTSCNISFGDTSEPYTTSDTTPTFTFPTDIAANCRIDDANQNHSSMGSSRNCAGGQGTTSHTCTLTVQDELVASADEVFVACAGTGGDEATNSSARMLMDITGLSNTSTDAIDVGIQASAIWPGATVYTNQQVYLRNLNNSQVVGTVDKIAVYGNQRWLFNNALDGESTLGLFNMTPVVYVLDLINTSSEEVKRQVSTLINATKR